MSDDQKRRILAVDDEVLLAMELEYVLSDAGYSVVGPAGTLKQGLDLIASNAIDAAVLDLNLGGTRSDEIADTLAKKGIPFLFITGHRADALPPEHRDRPLVSKPFAEHQLLASLRQLF